MEEIGPQTGKERQKCDPILNRQPEIRILFAEPAELTAAS